MRIRIISQEIFFNFILIKMQYKFTQLIVL